MLNVLQGKNNIIIKQILSVFGFFCCCFCVTKKRAHSPLKKLINLSCPPRLANYYLQAKKTTTKSFLFCNWKLLLFWREGGSLIPGLPGPKIFKRPNLAINSFKKKPNPLKWKKAKFSKKICWNNPGNPCSTFTKIKFNIRPSSH